MKIARFYDRAREVARDRFDVPAGIERGGGGLKGDSLFARVQVVRAPLRRQI